MSFAAGLPTVESKDFPGSGFTDLNGSEFYRIADVDRLSPFFVNVVSHCDVWMYVSSRGGLSAGRVDAEGALFPYETVDRIHGGHHHTGGYAQFWVHEEGESPGTAGFWEPFSDIRPGQRPVRRSLLKNLVGNQLVFEEFDESTRLVFRTRWAATDALGIVRSTEILNSSDRSVTISVFDGFRNVLPWGIPLATYQVASCLTDAYKRSECDASSGLGIFAMTAGISDGTHPMEVLRANVAWSVGLPKAAISLSSSAPQHFREGRNVPRHHLSAGGRGNFFVSASQLRIPPGQRLRWHIVGDVGYDHLKVVALRDALLQEKWDGAAIDQAIQEGTDDLVSKIAGADGLQHSADKIATVHHFANVLFNSMRGGIFIDDYRIEKDQFLQFVRDRNQEVAERSGEFFQSLSSKVDIATLTQAARKTSDVDLQRLVDEYLPLTFSRRHGDPSRPWNRFSIRLKGPNGEPQMNYEGNWRDIFQNWEGLCVSFPEYLPSVITKFLNGSTLDGFNPYRVTSEGMEWEEPNPEDPWSNIGYWGDHQIIYLLKLLESQQARQPGALPELLDCSRFVYLDVPYRLKPYRDLIRNGRETITFDRERARVVSDRMEQIGEDGSLLTDAHGEIFHVCLAEKLLVPMLSKLSNFVIDGGIWMNTQRPEWNDANNALVGNGVSVVTLCYLRRYLEFCGGLFRSAGHGEYAISPQVCGWLQRLGQVMTEHEEAVTQGTAVDDRVRREFLDRMGKAFCEYRQDAYQHGLSRPERANVTAHQLADFCELAKKFVDLSIRHNCRPDGLYHAYNLIDLEDGQARLRNLYEMLEGQVAVLSSGVLSPEKAADLVESLYLSRIYREDQKSFMLYPERQLSDFLDRNVIPELSVQGNPLLQQMLAASDTTVVARDGMGVYRFNAQFRHTNDLNDALDAAARKDAWSRLVREHRGETLTLFESVFQHKSYTGRSGTMYGYEGLGCIYWHMVSKLLLAVQENYLRAVDKGNHAEVAARLAKLYYRVRDGLGPAKSPEEFGAFPTDPYSHTPGDGAARQPGMTGQVKEEILTRFGELGVRVVDGRLEFRPSLLRTDEFYADESTFAYVSLHGEPQNLELPARCLAFTYCQIPIVYQLADGGDTIEVNWESGEPPLVLTATTLDAETTSKILTRTGAIACIFVRLSPHVFVVNR